MTIVPYTKKLTHEMFGLLLAADPDRAAINTYISNSTIVVCQDGDDLMAIGVLSNCDDCYEIRNLSVKESYQGRGIGKSMVTELVKISRNSGGRLLEVGTGNSSLAQLAFYQKCEFRMNRIANGYFDSYSDPIIENGIRCRDLVYLQLEL